MLWCTLQLEMCEFSLIACGVAGRVNLVDLQQLLNVDLSHIEAKVNELVKNDPSLTLILGQIINRYRSFYTPSLTCGGAIKQCCDPCDCLSIRALIDRPISRELSASHNLIGDRAVHPVVSID